MFNPRTSLRCLLVASVILLHSGHIYAQALPQGIPWYTVPLPIPGGFVDAATGNVHLEFPLASIAERNGDPLVTKAVFDSTLYSYNGGFGAQGPGWRIFTGNSHSGTGSYSTSTQSCTSAGYSSYPNGQVTLWYFWFSDSHGTVVPNNLYTKRVTCSNQYGTYYGSGDDITSFTSLATDGSGYTFKVANYTNFQVVAPDGTIVYDFGYGTFHTEYPVDTNGNYASYGIGSQPDMLGRSPFTFQPNNGVNPCNPLHPGTSISIRASDGSTSTYTFPCTSQSVAEVLYGTQYTGTEWLLTSIALPDQTQYSFAYDTGTSGTHLGALSSITLPTGGVVSFTYTTLTGGNPNFPGLLGSVTLGGGTWNLSYVWNGSARTYTTTALSPARPTPQGNVRDQTVFTSVPNAQYVQTAQYYSGTSTLLRTVNTTYVGNYLPSTVTTTLNDTGQSSSVSYQYYNSLRDYPTQKQETDFIGAIIRTTKITYNPAFTKPT